MPDKTNEIAAAAREFIKHFNTGQDFQTQRLMAVTSGDRFASKTYWEEEQHHKHRAKEYRELMAKLIGEERIRDAREQE